MQLMDIADMKEYLENRCYCPYEIYDRSGFFCKLFKPETECEHIIGGEQNGLYGDFVTAGGQIIYIQHKDGYVEDCVRFDATENNIRQVKMFMSGETEFMDLDKYDTKALEEVMSIADAVMVG